MFLLMKNLYNYNKILLLWRKHVNEMCFYNLSSYIAKLFVVFNNAHDHILFIKQTKVINISYQGLIVITSSQLNTDV